MSTEKTSSDPHLLARVLDDARQADEQTQSAFAANREQIILRNKDLFARYSELSGGRRLVAYFAKIEHPNAAMQPSDVAPITALLEREEKTKDLDLWINSPGGSAQTAEKIVSACRAVCDGEFRVVVPNMAKSAATMTALCADQIVMGYLSELGPIDPQVPIRVGGMVRYVSAQSFLDGQRARSQRSPPHRRRKNRSSGISSCSIHRTCRLHGSPRWNVRSSLGRTWSANDWSSTCCPAC